MRTITKILIVLVCMSLFTVTGCEYGEQILTGLGIGAGGNEILNTYENVLENKRTELNAAYDQAIANMQNATDPNELEFEKRKAKDIQIARIANVGALSAIREIKSQGTEQPNGESGQLGLLHGVIPLLIAWGGNELRKRKGFEKVVNQLSGEATPNHASHIHEVVKSKTRILG